MTKLLEIRVRGLRTLADVSLTFGGLTVLIGDNGTGKSTLLEALRIVSLIPSGKLIEELHRSHAIGTALRRDCPGLKIDVRVEYDDREYVYALTLSDDAYTVASEAFFALPRKGMTIAEGSELSGDALELLFRRSGAVVASEIAQIKNFKNIRNSLPLLDHLARGSSSPDVFTAVGSAFTRITNHLPFDVTSLWGKRQRGGGEKAPLREPRLVEPGHQLDIFGDNLVNVYQTLKNDKGSDHWRNTLQILRLGLGAKLQDVAVTAVGGGYLALAIEFADVGSVPAVHLADGILSYMASVAMLRLDEGRTLLTFDEPETHLHPALLARVMTLFDDAATRYPVILSTHSDRLLDSLVDPVASVVVCELDAQRRTRLRRLDPEQFEKWRSDFLGVGDIRAESQLESILAESAE